MPLKQRDQGVLMRRVHVTVLLGVLIELTALAQISQACSSCGCTLNSDWSSQGYTTHSGLHLDLRYDGFDQDDLRVGDHQLSRHRVVLPDEREVQHKTRNRNTTIGIDYSPSRNWGVSLQVPYFDRPHSTTLEGETDTTTSHSRGIGDARVLARYQGFQDDLSYGVQFGLKLPSGKYDDKFRSGPQQGEIVDRGLQVGTGTTDVLVGVYTAGNLGGGIAYFGSAMWQQPLNSRASFKPGAGANVTVGVRYRLTLPMALTPQLQLNGRYERRESGPNADIENSGATLIYLSPGVTFRVLENMDGFAFVQVPIYQHVTGRQLEPKVLASFGVRYAL